MEQPSFSCKLGVLSRPDGSVMFSEGQTTVIAGLYGPVEVKMQKLLIDKASVECSYRPKSGLPGVEDRLYESLIRNICETALAASLFPRSAVLVNIQEMENSGQLISCAINAACLSCLDSGIDMKFMFGAVSCFLTEDNEFHLIPPINDSSVKASFIFVFENVKERILASHTEGSFTKEQYEEAFNLSKQQSKNVFLFFKKILFSDN
ncbi:exosome complex component RRP46 [Anoplophora glabripennis]|uniref:exosome complex component RRP46 n=1 Tax=Anoplophora glabripennis TaxID=217634 RepID=UPI000873729B|nr:exosome complex component RRP46 [Anoplophora glabripennis]